MLISSQFYRCFPGITSAQPELSSLCRTLWRAFCCIILWLHFVIFNKRIALYYSDYKSSVSLYITCNPATYFWSVAVHTSFWICVHVHTYLFLTFFSFLKNKNKDFLYNYIAYCKLAIVLRDIHYYLFYSHNSPYCVICSKMYIHTAEIWTQISLTWNSELLILLSLCIFTSHIIIFSW